MRASNGFGDVAGSSTFKTVMMAEHGKPCVLRQGGQGRESVLLFHISTNIEIIGPRQGVRLR